MTHIEDMRKVKGVPYEVVGNQVTIYEPGKDPATIDLILGKSTYHIVHSYLFSKNQGGPRVKRIGNFTWEVEDDMLTVFRKDGEVLGTKELVTDAEVKYPRRQAIELVLNTLE